MPLNDTYNPLPALIEFAGRLRYEDLPANVVHEAKRRVIDSIGTAMGSLSDERLVQRRRYFARRKVAYPEGGLIFGSKDKLTLPDAAFMNSTMTRWVSSGEMPLKLPLSVERKKARAPRARARSSSSTATSRSS